MFPGALVTGSTSGIGLAIAQAMSKIGMNVVLSGSSSAFVPGRGAPLFGDSNSAGNVHTFKSFDEEVEHAIKVVEQAAKFSNQQKVWFVETDLSRSNEVEGLMSSSISYFGKGISVLVNNAGVQVKPSPFSLPKLTPEGQGQHGSPRRVDSTTVGEDEAAVVSSNSFIDGVPIEGTEVSQWEKVMAINLTAPFLTMKCAMPVMKRQEFGRIINIVGPLGLVGAPNKSAYSASKHGLIGLTKSVALEGAPHGVTCNAVCPGFVHSPTVDRLIEKKMLETGSDFETCAAELIMEETPAIQFVGADEVAAAVSFFALPSSRSTNGSILSVDGGYVAH